MDVSVWLGTFTINMRHKFYKKVSLDSAHKSPYTNTYKDSQKTF